MRRILENLTTTFRAPWLLAIGIALCVSFCSVWFGALNQDEGWYLYAAQMVREGFLPYRDFFYTQGPAMPFVYAPLVPVWGQASPLGGLLGGRVVTLGFGVLAILCAMALARGLVPRARRPLAGFVVFCVLSCNLYHQYFTTIPKTYALGSFFLTGGLLLVLLGLTDRRAWRGALGLFAGGLALAFATGTRISLLLVLPVVGFTLLAGFRHFRWAFLWFGLGGMLGLFLTYGLFALDPASLRGLLAAQRYHAARGGFDLFFALGSVSRLARGYAALGVVLFACCAFRRPRDAFAGLQAEIGGSGEEEPGAFVAARRALRWMLGLGFAAVFALQLSAPFPYDDYQVPVMGLLTVLVGAWFARRMERPVAAAWFVVLVAGLASFVSPQLQEWATYSQDRFWSQKKEMTELAKLRQVGREIEALDPNGGTLLTQDLYLAIETGRKVPRGLEMGPFSYFPDMETEEAEKIHVLNRPLLERLMDAAPCPVAACSGYAFAISAPTCAEVPFEEQKRLFGVLKRNYEFRDSVPKFGQNATTLLILARTPGKGAAK